MSSGGFAPLHGDSIAPYYDGLDVAIFALSNF
jgi:hypothetical protein